MSLKLSDAPAGGSNFTNPPLDESSYVGVITQVVDIGMQPKQEWDKVANEFKPVMGKDGKQVYSRKIHVTFVLPGEPIEFKWKDKETGEEKEGIKQRYLSQEFTYSSSENSKLLKLYKTLKLESKDGLEKLLGKAVLLQVSVNGKGTHNNIKGFQTMVKGMTVPELDENVKMVYWDTEGGEADVFMTEIPQFIQKMIRDSKDFEKSKAAKKIVAYEVEHADDNADDKE